MKTLEHPFVMGLPDLCADIFTFCLQLQRTKDPGDPEQLRLKFDELFRTLETRARQSDVAEPHAALAKYAIVAYIDEMILSSDWMSVKDVWSGRPLQLEYFNEFSAGEIFFEKLQGLRGTDNPKQLDVMEVFYTCLALGFKGMHGADLAGIEKLKSLTENIGRELRRGRQKGAEDNQLSTGWKPPDAMPQLVKRFPAWVVTAICAVLLLALFIVLIVLVNGTAGGVAGGLG